MNVPSKEINQILYNASCQLLTVNLALNESDSSKYTRRYPAIPQTNPLEEAVIEAEKRAYLVRLRKDTFYNLELAKCSTLKSVLELSDQRKLADKMHENGLKFMKAKQLSKYEFYSDVDNWPGIPITVQLVREKAQDIIKRQNKDSYFVRGQEEIYTQEEWELKEQTIENLKDQLQDIFSETSEVLHKLANIENTHRGSDNKREDLSNTSYLYEIASKGKWKTMIDFKGFVLPGTADPHKTCGTWRFSVCRDHNYGKRIIHSCNRLSCPTCVQKAGTRIAKKIERRIWLYRFMIQKTTNNRRNPLPSHIVESIPAGDIFWSWSKSKQQRTLKQMRKIAGISGGVSINHNWRFEDGKTNPYVSIHNHLIAFGWLERGDVIKKRVFEKFGVDVIYKKTPDGTLKGRKNVFSLGYYLLSHCSIKNHKHSVHWFGEMSYRKIQNSYLKKFRDDIYILEDVDIEKSKSCKLCGELLVPAKINKDYRLWQGFLPDPDEMDQGCMFPEGLLLELDFMSEKMEFYDFNYDTIHHQTNREVEEQRYENYPGLYKRSTSSLRIDSWV